MIYYIASDNTLSSFPDLIDIAIVQEITVYAVQLTSAVVTTNAGSQVSLPINVIGVNLYTIQLTTAGNLELTDIDGPIVLQLHADFFEPEPFHSWLTRNQLFHLSGIFESKSNVWLKRFTLYAKDINKYIGTYRVIDIIMNVLNIGTYHLEREWIDVDIDPLVGPTVWLQMTDKSLISAAQQYKPTGNLKLFYVSNGVEFTTQEILKIVKHVLPAVNYIEDAEESYTVLFANKLSQASQPTQVSWFQGDINALLSCSDSYSIQEVPATSGNYYAQLIVNAQYPYVFQAMVNGQIWTYYSDSGLLPVLIPYATLDPSSLNNPGIQCALHMLMPNGLVKSIGSEIPWCNPFVETTPLPLSWNDFNHNDFWFPDFS